MTTTNPVPDTSPTTNPLRVAIADDHRLMLDGIKRALETAPDIKVVGEATNGEEMLTIVPRVRPDVVILDLRMPKGDGLTTLAALRKDYPDLKIIILSMSEDSEHIDQALHRAPRATWRSDQPARPAVHDPPGRRGHRLPPARPWRRGRLRPHRRSGGHPGGLTDRELSILRLVAEGLSNLDIASKLYVTEQTVKFHLSNIYRKLGVGNRTEATRYAYRNGLIE